MKRNALTWQKLYKILLYLIGLAGTCVGVSLCLKSTMGVDAWNAAMAGLSEITPISLGKWTIMIQLSFWIISTLIDRKIRWCSVFPVLYKGFILDLVKPLIDKIEFSENTLSLLIVFFIGYLIISISTGIYISTEYPRMPIDGLMFSLAAFLHKEIKQSRLIIEVTGFFIMFMAHGAFGIGTVIMTATCGYMFSMCNNISKKVLINTFQK